MKLTFMSSLSFTLMGAFIFSKQSSGLYSGASRLRKAAYLYVEPVEKVVLSKIGKNRLAYLRFKQRFHSEESFGVAQIGAFL